MFTGLIEDLGTVRELRRESRGVCLTVGTQIPTAELRLGDIAGLMEVKREFRKKGIKG